MLEIPPLAEWSMRNPERRKRKWTVIGKGPGFSRLAENLTEESIGLNHVWEKVDSRSRLTVLHAFDLDVVERLSTAALQKFEFLWLPDTMNVNLKLGRSKGLIHQKDILSTSRRLSNNQYIQSLISEGRVFCYPRGDTSSEIGGFPLRVGAFSGSTVIALLAALGIKDISLAGIDGGADYSPAFAHLENHTKLNGGQDSYSPQLKEIATIRRRMGLHITDLGESALRVFVGTTVGQRIPFEILKYSIDRHSSRTVEIYALDEEIRKSGIAIDKLQRIDKGGTPFSFQRYLIPAICGYSGTAIYLDSDMLVFDDIGLLNSFSPLSGCANSVLTDHSWDREPQLSVMVIRCDRATWDLATLKKTASSESYAVFRSEGPTPHLMERSIPSTWNSLEHYQSGVTQLLHYTDMAEQPWLSISNPLCEIWMMELFHALDANVLSSEVVESEIKAGHVRPGILEQVRRRLPDPLSLPKEVVRHDLEFLPPNILMNHPAVSKAAGIGHQLPTPRELFIRRVLGRLRRALMTPMVYVPTKFIITRMRKIVRLLKKLLGH